MRRVTIDDLAFNATLIGANPKGNRIILETKDQDALKALAESDEPFLIGEDGVATSPLAHFPGFIRFPQWPGGKEFKAAYNATQPAEGDPPTPMLANGRRMRPVIPYWRVVQAIAVEVCVETPDGRTVTLETDIDDVPSPVLDWASLCVEEYDGRFLRSGL